MGFGSRGCNWKGKDLIKEPQGKQPSRHSLMRVGNGVERKCLKGPGYLMCRVLKISIKAMHCWEAVEDAGHDV